MYVCVGVGVGVGVWVGVTLAYSHHVMSEKLRDMQESTMKTCGVHTIGAVYDEHAHTGSIWSTLI